MLTAKLRKILIFAMLTAALPGFAGASQAAGAGTGGVAVISAAGTAAMLTPAQLQALPAVTVNAAFGTAHGPFQAVFSGPLLWTVLNAAAAIDPRQPKTLLRECVLVTGADGYSALLALGEIAPAFEDKNVILATKMNGKSLGPRHFRIVVPGDKKGGRSVRDVVRIEISLPIPGK